MATFSLEDTIKTFSSHQATVVYWFCKGLSNEEIAARYNYQKSWVVWQMSFVYFKLGLDRKDANGRSLHWGERRRVIREKVCPIIARLTNDDPELLERFPLISPNVLEGSILDLRPEIPVPPSEPFVPPPEPPSEPPQLPAPGEIPPLDPPSNFYPIELYNAWLAVLEDDRGDPSYAATPPAEIRPERHGIMWGRILVLLSAVVLGCAIVGVLAYWFGIRQNLPPTPSPIPSATEQILATATLVQTATVTLTIAPSETLAPTSSPTLTPTTTPIPTNTVPPVNLTKGAVLQDNRVTLKFQEIGYEQGRTRVGQRLPAPIVFEFDFTNRSGETLFLQIGQDQFRAEDNLGNQLTCEFWNGSSQTEESLQRPLENEKTFDLAVFCGEGKIPSGVTTYTLYVTGFSSLPDSTWIAAIAR